MTRALLIPILLFASCAKQPIRGGAELPRVAVDRGQVADFGTVRPLCIRATDTTNGNNLDRAVAAAVTARLPDVVISCTEPERLVLTFQTGISSYTHGPAKGPRYSFVHLGIEHVERGYSAEATMWDFSGGSNAELADRGALALSIFMSAARSQLPPNQRMQPPAVRAVPSLDIGAPRLMRGRSVDSLLRGAP